MSIQISEGGRLFGILAGLGGAAMVGGAGLPWTLVDVRGGIPVHEYSVPWGIASADGRTMLVLGLFVMAGTACFTALVRASHNTTETVDVRRRFVRLDRG